MSADRGVADDMIRCASCGIAEVDDIKLKECDAACKLVRYCSIKCQRDHRPQHENSCKKRAAELRDELLFKQPESSLEWDCPICLLPLQARKFIIQACYSKIICYGCVYANLFRERAGSLVLELFYCTI